MAEEQTTQQIKEQIKDVLSRIYGIDYYLIQQGKKSEQLEMLERQFGSFRSPSYFTELGYSVALQELVLNLQLFKKEALSFGLPSADITDENLRGYAKLFDADMKEREKEDLKGIAEGLTARKSMIRSALKGPGLH